MTSAAHTLVVGAGNPLQGLDGFGPAVIARLRTRNDLAGSATFIDAGTDLLASFDRFAAADIVVLVDAYLGSGSGSVALMDESNFATWPVDSPSVHNLSAVLAVRLFRKLYPGDRPAFVLVGLDAPSISTSIPLSANQVEEGVRSVLTFLNTAT